MKLLMLWNWLLGRSQRRLADVVVVFYTRSGCHLCEDAWAFLEAEQRRRGFRLESVNVDDSPDLAAAYGTDVPVVVVGGRVRFRGRVNRVLWARLLRAEFERANSRPGPAAPGQGL